jgi:hypothetical protein
MPSGFARTVLHTTTAAAIVTLLGCSAHRDSVRASGQSAQTRVSAPVSSLQPVPPMQLQQYPPPMPVPDSVPAPPPARPVRPSPFVAKARPLPATEPAPEPALAAPLVIPSGTRLRVRLSETLDTRDTRAGETFRATLDEPIVVGHRVAVPKGTLFTGTILRSKSSGRFRGRAQIELTLLSFQLNGQTHRVETRPDTRVSGSHKKRNWWLLGGGTAGGAGIGALAGGGTGALIGAGAGAAAGTTTAFFTGKKNVKLPVETPIVFSLRSNVAV